MNEVHRMINIQTPISQEVINNLNIGDHIYISGFIYCGRDAVLPKVVEMTRYGIKSEFSVNLNGGAIFHTAVSQAGVGPTSSNKLEIESSIEPLSKIGVRLHLGKGKIHEETIKALEKYHAVYAVIPPVTALLGEKTLSQKLIAFPELGMEALYQLNVKSYPAIIAAAHGRSIY